MTTDGKPSMTTRLARLGLSPSDGGKPVNPPIARGGTILLPRAEDLYRDDIKTYGLEGHDVHDALREALKGMVGASDCLLLPSGLAACTLPLFALLAPGDEVLITDSVYGPNRRFADQELGRFGINVRYFDPLIGSGISSLLSDATRMIFLESPGSLTMELQDVPAIVAVAKAKRIVTVIDDTWSAGVLMNPLEMGVDLSIQALTKYQSGHSDALAGAILTRRPELARRLKQASQHIGFGTSSEDASLVLRGLRSLTLRLNQHGRSSLAVAAAFRALPGVTAILHPALPEHPQNALYKRDFTGPAGLFSIVVEQALSDRVNAFLNRLQLFGLGFSWGGFESLVIPCNPQLNRTAKPWTGGQLIRFSIGLEDPDDLIADIKQAWTAFDPG
jgi:cystathionine beta-lyase